MPLIVGALIIIRTFGGVDLAYLCKVTFGVSTPGTKRTMGRSEPQLNYRIELNYKPMIIQS